MNARLGWALAATALALGGWQYGWPGVLLAVSVIVFWLLLQFTRTLRTMRTAARSPLARVDSAAMFAAGLRPGLSLLQVIQSTRSLGERVDGADASGADGGERWRWADAGGATVTLAFARGRLRDWQLQRPADQAGSAASAAAASHATAGEAAAAPRSR